MNPMSAAARGLAWLKEEGPAYGLDYTRIDPATLDMGKEKLCALAQAGRCHYGEVVERIESHILTTSDMSVRDWVRWHGFNISSALMLVPIRQVDEACSRLTDAWLKLLEYDRNQRLGAAVTILEA